MATRKPPSGGPMNWFMATSTPYSRPLATLSRSRATMLGMIDWAAVSKRVSPTPSTKAVT